MTTAEKFRYFRHWRGITQKQLAIALGITRRAVIYIESGQREPRMETEQKFQELVNRHAREANGNLRGCTGEGLGNQNYAKQG